jgi:SHAQKYF class myb-like DNA-binding protein
MIDNKNLINYENKISMIPPSISENQNLQAAPNENPIDYEIKNEDNYSGNNGRWETSEHLRFLGGCLQYGNNWKKVETYVRTRTSTQIRSHAQKYLKKLEKKYYSKGFSQNQNGVNDSFSDEITINNAQTKNQENSNNIEEKKVENLNINENIHEENNVNNENTQLFSLKNEEMISVDNKTKLSDEKIKKLIEDLPKPGFNLEIVERIILRIFRLNKKIDDFPKLEITTKKSNQKANSGNSKNNKNIFLCQKLKRQINYEAQIKELLSSNNQNDLKKLFKIFEEGRDSTLYNILMKHLNDN